MKSNTFMTFACTITLLLDAAVSVAEDTSAGQPAILSHGTISDVTYLPDFSYAGYANGNHAVPKATGTVIAVDDFGAVPDDSKDDTKAVLAALSDAHRVSGPVIVRFSAGRYRLTEILRIERSDIVLQGAGYGDGGTTLFFPRPLNQVDRSSSLDELREYIVKLDKRQVEPDLNLDDYFSEYSWSGGFIWIQKPGTRTAPYLVEYDPVIEKLADVASAKRGARQVTLSDNASINVGDIVQVQWINRSGPGAGIIKALYGSAFESAGSHHWSFPERYRLPTHYCTTCTTRCRHNSPAGMALSASASRTFRLNFRIRPSSVTTWSAAITVSTSRVRSIPGHVTFVSPTQTAAS